ncbi:MAG: DUF3180 family protein [Streptosporangiales bacterium]|nr:DUF3180 family protein [Streptosporangiales bacterium]
MTPSRWQVLLGLFLVPAAVVWPLMGSVYSSLPPLPWTAVPTLLLLALGEFYSAFGVRARLHGHPLPAWGIRGELRRLRAEVRDLRAEVRSGRGTQRGSRIDPLTIARFAALGKASAHAAAVLAGIFTGILLHVAGNLDIETPRADAWVSGATAVSALVLVVAALFLEYSCRVPKGPDDRDPPSVPPTPPR